MNHGHTDLTCSVEVRCACSVLVCSQIVSMTNPVDKILRQKLNQTKVPKCRARSKASSLREANTLLLASRYITFEPWRDPHDHVISNVCACAYARAHQQDVVLTSNATSSPHPLSNIEHKIMDRWQMLHNLSSAYGIRLTYLQALILAIAQFWH